MVHTSGVPPNKPHVLDSVEENKQAKTHLGIARAPRTRKQ